MKNYLIPIVLLTLLVGCGPDKREQVAILVQARESVISNLKAANSYQITILKIKVTSFDERFMGWVKGEWVACAEAVPLAESKIKLPSRKFFFSSNNFGPLVIVAGKYPEIDKGWLDLCDFD